MFKITNFQRLADDKIRLVIETDDPSSVLFFQFFSDAKKFADLYNYRFRTASKLDLFRKNKPARLEQERRFYGEQLAMFRKLEGSRIERFRLIKKLRESNGDRVTLDKIMSEIKKARDNEREDTLNNIRQLSKKGYSLTQISAEMGIPKSTISRHCKRISAEPNNIKEVSPVPSRVLPLRKGKI